MIFRRTKMIKTPKGATTWAQEYMDETGKHKGKDLSEMGMGIGRNYFTSRAPGHLSAHGYVRPAIAQLKLTRRMSDNEAILHYIQKHCNAQQKKRRTIMAIRAIVSLDPERVADMVGQHLDVDELLVKATEATFKELTDRYYPGQELAFLMGIHHDKLTANVVNPNIAGKTTHNPARLGKPHLHGHLFIFPQTVEGRRIGMSRNSYPKGMEKPVEDMLGHCREIFAAKTQDLSVEVISPLLTTPGWNAMFKLASLLTLTEFQAGQELSPENSRKFITNRVVYYLTSLDREKLRKRLKARQEKMQELTNEILHAQPPKISIPSHLEMLTEQVIDRVQQFAPSHQARIREIEDVRANYNKGQDYWFSPKFSFHALGNTKKATATLPLPWAASNPLPWYDFGPNRTTEIAKLCRTLRMRRKASRVSLAAEMADSESNLASVLSAGGEQHLPSWFKILNESLEGTLPHQFMLTNRPVAPESYEVIETPAEPIDPTLGNTTTLPQPQQPHMAQPHL